jgi:hypothetical protein
VNAPTSGRALLVLHQRAARLKALDLGVAEALAMFDGANASLEVGGPLADQSGVAWISVDADHIADVEATVHLLGYVEAVDVVEPADARDPGAVRWRKRSWRMRRVADDISEQLRDQAPDRRAFVLGTEQGTRLVRGYRGSGKPMERRGLPVIDARLLVNLATCGRRSSRLLDPFGGAGGIVVAGQAAGHVTFSADLDPVVAVGLNVLTEGRHIRADVRSLPFADASFEAIATETPFAEAADDAVAAMLPELVRVLCSTGRLAMMCVERQAQLLRERVDMLRPLVDQPVDRKGLATRVLAWERA